MNFRPIFLAAFLAPLVLHAADTARSACLQAQMTHLQRRLHREFCYLAAFADGGSEAK